MTELETRLLAAFEQLSTQYSGDQQRQQAQIEALSQQVQTLVEQQRTLMERYNRVVALLNEELEW